MQSPKGHLTNAFDPERLIRSKFISYIQIQFVLSKFDKALRWFFEHKIDLPMIR